MKVGSLVKLKPEIGVITNIELDHTDHYPDLNSITTEREAWVHYLTNGLEENRIIKNPLDKNTIVEKSFNWKLYCATYPEFNLNRQKDMQTGENQHVIETDLIVSKKQDIDLERILQSWRGTRHSLNLKVRGQRTRCTGRAGKVVGVRKSTLKPGKAS